MKAVILASGIGSRLKSDLPKALTKLPDGKTILARQVDILKESKAEEIITVVGYRKEEIIERFPELTFVYNPDFKTTNTSKSLMLALQSTGKDDILWLNGDVCLDREVVSRVLQKGGNAIGVNSEECGEEEVKYLTDKSGKIIEISKQVKIAEGEAIGVNFISEKDFSVFLEKLVECDDNDYFEKGVELAVNAQVDFFPADISGCRCIEVDFKEDLEKAKKMFR
jgi:choline kinase